MSKLKQLKCPSCGATLNQSSPNQLIVECPYCHQQVVNETYQTSGKNNGPHVLEFSMNEEDVIKKMVNMLVEDQSVATDIFDKMSISSIKRYYVPMYKYEGTFRAPWTGERRRDEKRQRIGRDGKIEDYYETFYDNINGEAVGNFSVNSVSLNDVHSLQLDFADIQKIVINPSSLPLLSDANSTKDENNEFILPSGNSDSVWWESGESEALNIGAHAAHIQALGFGVVADTSVSCELKKTSFIYIPLWIIKYDYLGQTFVFHSYAEQNNTISHPNAEK